MLASLLHLWMDRVLKVCFESPPWAEHNELADRIYGNRSTIIRLRAAEFIYANFDCDINILQIARQVGITARHLIRICHQYLLRSVNATVRDANWTEAFKPLNSKPVLRYKEMVYAAVFSNPSYLAPCFNHRYNLLPTHIIENLSDTVYRALRHFIPNQNRALSLKKDTTITDHEPSTVVANGTIAK